MASAYMVYDTKDKKYVEIHGRCVWLKKSNAEEVQRAENGYRPDNGRFVLHEYEIRRKK